MVRKNLTNDPITVLRRGLGETLRRLRIDARLTQVELGRAIHTTDSTISELELGRGTRPPDERLVGAYVEACLAGLPVPAAIRAERKAAILEELRVLTGAMCRIKDISSARQPDVALPVAGV